MSNSATVNNEKLLTEMFGERGLEGAVEYGRKSIHTNIEGYWFKLEGGKRWMFIGADEQEASEFVKSMKNQ